MKKQAAFEELMWEELIKYTNQVNPPPREVNIKFLPRTFSSILKPRVAIKVYTEFIIILVVII